MSWDVYSIIQRRQSSEGQKFEVGAMTGIIAGDLESETSKDTFED